jgi:phosphopentomutase
MVADDNAKDNTIGVKRVVLIVIDSVGVGELSDADKYGDTGSNTLGNTSRAAGGLKMPNLGSMGIGNIIPIEGVPPTDEPTAFYGKMAEVSAGKDTTTGHWEMMGLHLDKPFPTYPNGFPEDVIKAFENATGKKVLGNKPASGTAIIDELGPEHMRTGNPIVYTSADSVFQIAAHEDVIPIEELYKMCEIARNILTGEHAAGRVIARPFIGEPGNFTRTHRRRDFSLKPIGKTVLDYLSEAGLTVYGVGKISEIFAGQGLTGAIHTESNAHGIDETINAMGNYPQGLIFTNLVDFDSKWGHRNDPQGYATGLEYFDARLPGIIARLNKEDVLIITADHGCDPTTISTDHSREYVPLIVYGEALSKQVYLGVRPQFSDLGKTVADLLGVDAPVYGVSFKDELIRDHN